jgi:hypothetical protein
LGWVITRAEDQVAFFKLALNSRDRRGIGKEFIENFDTHFSKLASAKPRPRPDRQ